MKNDIESSLKDYLKYMFKKYPNEAWISAELEPARKSKEYSIGNRIFIRSNKRLIIVEEELLSWNIIIITCGTTSFIAMFLMKPKSFTETDPLRI